MRACVVVVLMMLGVLVPVGVIGDSGSGGGLRVVVTFPGLVDDVKPLLAGGDSVESLLEAGVDPHEYQLTPGDVDRLREADIIVSTGHTGFEADIRRLVEEGEIRAVLIEIPRIPGIRILRNPATGQPNYHMPIYDPVNYKIFINYLAEKMAGLRPGRSAQYSASAARITGIVDEVMQSAVPVNAAAVADTPLTQYAVTWLNVSVNYLVVKEHGAPASPQDLAIIEDRIRSGEIRLAVVTTPAVLKASRDLLDLAKRYGLPVLYVKSPMSQGGILEKIRYVAEQSRNVSRSVEEYGSRFTRSGPDPAVVAAAIALVVAVSTATYILVSRRRGGV